jgi:hypothetical protein
MGLLKFIQALQAAEALLAKYAPMAQAAAAAYAKGGWAGLVLYLESQIASPQPNGPPAAELRTVADQLKAAHA